MMYATDGEFFLFAFVACVVFTYVKVLFFSKEDK